MPEAPRERPEKANAAWRRVPRDRASAVLCARAGQVSVGEFLDRIFHDVFGERAARYRCPPTDLVHRDVLRSERVEKLARIEVARILGNQLHDAPPKLAG